MIKHKYRGLIVLISVWLLLPSKAHAVLTSPLNGASQNIQQAYLQIIADFTLYQQLFLVEDSSRVPAVLINAHNPQEARSFLRPGFCEALADAICSNYTQYDKERQLLYLIPGDGLPRLGIEEQNGVKYSRETNELLRFEYLYENCYQPGDAYLYIVKARSEEGHWKIEDLELIEVRCGSFFY